MKRILIILSIILLATFVYAGDFNRIEALGVGAPVSQHASLETKKQEAFFAAFVAGVRELIAITHGMNIESRIRFVDQKDSEKTLASTQGVIKDIAINSQLMVEGSLVTEDIISCTYKKQKIVVRQSKLVFPPIEFIEFPNWQNRPKTISGIDIKNIEWNWSETGGDRQCLITLAYLYDPSIIKKKKGGEAKKFTFKYEKDNLGNLIYESVMIDGTAYGGGNDAPDGIRKNALDEALKNAIEKVNGVYIQTLTKVENATLTKDEIISQTLGVAKILEKKYKPKFTSQGNYEVTCTVSAKVPLMILVPIR